MRAPFLCLLLLMGAGTAQADAWLDTQITTGRYVPDGGWLMSHEWIEPRVMVRAEQSDTGSLFVVVETDLES